MYTGDVMIFTTAPKMSDVPTAIRAGTPRARISKGVVSVPAPTPVSPIAIAITNPSAYAMRSKEPLIGLNVDAALQLGFDLPASRARVVRIERQIRAWLAADAGVSQIVQRQRRNLVPIQIIPHVAVGPGGKRTHFFENFAGG